LDDQVLLGQMLSSQVKALCNGRMSCAFAHFCAVHLHTTGAGELNCDSLLVIYALLTYWRTLKHIMWAARPRRSTVWPGGCPVMGSLGYTEKSTFLVNAR
jgi:hypothetical protein